MLITLLLTTTSFDSSQQSKPDGREGPQLFVPQVNPLKQSKSISQSPSPNMQGLELVQQLHAPHVADPFPLFIKCVFVEPSMYH